AHLFTTRNFVFILSDSVPQYGLLFPGHAFQDLFFNVIEVFHYLPAKAILCSNENLNYL
ncbi:hypothetical protein N320_03171, partial [Buceros rhinoceros silvestris]